MLNERKTERAGAEKLFNFRPVFFSAIFLCLGVLFYFLYHYHGVSALWLLCLLPVAVTPFFFCRTKEKAFSTVAAVAALGICFFIGFFSFSVQTARFFDRSEYLGENYISGRVVEKRPYESQTGLVLDELYIGGERVEGKLIAYLPATFYEKVALSDEMFLKGEVHETSVTGDNFSLMAGEFGSELRFRLWADDAVVMDGDFDFFCFLRTRADEVIEAGMDETPAAVTKAVLFGETTGIDEGLYDNIRRGGIAHIFAVSGLHVGALFAFCLILMRKTALRRLPKAAQFVLLTLLLFTYAGVCGFSSSVLRASIMCLVVYASTLLSIKTDLIESLGLAAIVILLFTPSALFEIGFQLSFAACFGIAFLSKPIGHVFDEMLKLKRKLFPKPLTRAQKEALKNDDTLPPGIGERIYRAVRGFLSVSLSAQIFTAPLLLHYFGYVSGWALLLNGIFVPFISGVFWLLLLLVTLACLLPTSFAALILYLPNVIWSAALLIFQTLDFSSFALQGLRLSVGGMIAYFAAWLFCSDKWNLKKTLSFILAGGCFLTFVITMVALNI